MQKFFNWILSFFKSKPKVVQPLPPVVPSVETKAPLAQPITPAATGKQTINEAGLVLVKEFEGCFLLSYPDPASPLANLCRTNKVSAYTKYMSLPDWEAYSGAPWTIGWGATGEDIKPLMRWTQQQADDRLLIELEEHMEYVRKQLESQGLTASPNQFAALTSFTYNCGPGNLRRVLRNGFEGVPDLIVQFNKAQGQILPGLVRRRDAEKELFLQP